jgi:Zn-dependent M28 family amino/carboxypeptidase
MRISDGSEEGKHHAVLVNSHLDSTLPSPGTLFFILGHFTELQLFLGAADDALPVGVMIEMARVLIDTDDWEPHNAVIFLWNNAEESLQDGSHLYSTQHETAPT